MNEIFHNDVCHPRKLHSTGINILETEQNLPRNKKANQDQGSKHTAKSVIPGTGILFSNWQFYLLSKGLLWPDHSGP